MSRDSTKLSEKERLFVQHYCGASRGNASDAAIRAGYSPNGANHAAYKLLSRQKVKDAIAVHTAKSVKDAEITTEAIVKLLWKEANDHSETGSPHARIAALKQLANYTGGFDKNTRKVDVSNTDGSLAPVINAGDVLEAIKRKHAK